jgi:hypothetical protein
MVQNVGTNSKFLIPVIGRLCAQDPAFIELLLGSNHQGNATWDVATLVRQLYEQQSQER